MSTTTTETTRSSAEDALWAVISTKPTTASDLAFAAGISESKTRKILRQWATDGSITRHTDDDNPRAAARWSLTTAQTPQTPDDTDTPIAATEPEPDNPQTDGTTTPPEADDATNADPAPQTEPTTVDGDAPTDHAPEQAEQVSVADAPDQGKLAPGALRGLVEDHLRDHPSEEFSPHQIGKALGGRSSGAVHNALVKLVDAGVAKITSDRPKKFTLTPTES
ncbi:hypothetical protein [Nocardia sp. NPDC059195]|uniref:hypothetical protein n=1 Tax=Nocardia sp. NPDC059195 TaxID=3346765 RepID=UPI00367D1B5C